MLRDGTVGPDRTGGTPTETLEETEAGSRGDSRRPWLECWKGVLEDSGEMEEKSALSVANTRRSPWGEERRGEERRGEGGIGDKAEYHSCIKRVEKEVKKR